MDELQNVRAECSEVHDRLSSARHTLHAQRRSLNEERISLAAKFRQGGPYSTSQQRQYFELVRALHSSFIPITELMFQNASQGSALLIEILEPEALDTETKLIYARRILLSLRRRETEYLPQLKGLIERIATDVMTLKEFIDSQRPLEEGDPASTTDAKTADVGLDLDAKESELANDDRDDDRPDFEYRDEFLDSPEYRRIAKSLLENMLVPLEAFRPTLANLQETCERQFARVSEWQSSGPHGADQNRWITVHANEISTLSKSMAALLSESSDEVKRANRALRASFNAGDAPAVYSLQQYHDSLKVQVELVFPVLQTDAERAIAKVDEIIRFLDANGQRERGKRARRIWGRKEQ